MAKIPIVPEKIVVHLGNPDSTAENVTINFDDYIKNVASSEIYSTWPEESIKANMYAQISYALNRVYSEWYRSKGYDFDITNTTAYDQKFINNRNIFDNISEIADEIFNDYLRKQGTVNPLFAQYCNGTTVTCPGLSQWGTVDLAEEGKNAIEIVKYYYGDDTELVVDAPISENVPSYPGKALRLGDLSESVRRMQIYLNRISNNYPAIPKIPNVFGRFDESTEDAVKEFQKIFNLTPDGIIGKATWYKIIFIYSSVTNIAELQAEGDKYADLPLQFVEPLTPGSTGGGVLTLQYFLSLVADFVDTIPIIQINGYYDDATTNAVTAFQQLKGLPVTGIVNETTWNSLYATYEGIIKYLETEEASLVPTEPYPGVVLKRGSVGESVRVLKSYLNYISKYIYEIPVQAENTMFGPQMQNAVTTFQKIFYLPATGEVDEATWNEIVDVYKTISIGQMRSKGQYPGYVIGEEAE